MKSIYLGFRKVKVQRVTVVEFGMYSAIIIVIIIINIIKLITHPVPYKIVSMSNIVIRL